MHCCDTERRLIIKADGNHEPPQTELLRPYAGQRAFDDDVQRGRQACGRQLSLQQNEISAHDARYGHRLSLHHFGGHVRFDG